jgi:lipopolysaccharide/colanic/teichoic acid biosynthesis glycosyltransferase
MRRMELDAEHVAWRSLWFDLKLLMLTPTAVISSRSAY